MVDLSRVPLVALSSSTKELISTLLNPRRFISTQSGLPRDWKGLAHVCKIDQEMVRNIYCDCDPTGRVLSVVECRSKDFTLQSLKEALETIERWDVVDDSKEMIENDAKVYLERLERSQDAAEMTDYAVDSKILTIDDLLRMEQGQDTQHYDAFVLYAQEDIEFVNEVVDNLENKNNMKLCLKDRDLVAGATFEHEAIMRLILERCNRLILITSPDFFKSPANKFFMNFAQAAGIDKEPQRKIIPCVYKTCELPPQLQYFSKIYYNKLSSDYFWKRLVCSTKVIGNKNTTNENKNTKAKSKLQVKKRVVNAFVNEIMDDTPKEKKEKLKEPQEHQPIKSDPPKEDISDISEVIPDLPSLDGLSSLSPLTSVERKEKKTKKNKKFLRTYVKKIQTLLERS